MPTGTHPSPAPPFSSITSPRTSEWCSTTPSGTEAIRLPSITSFEFSVGAAWSGSSRHGNEGWLSSAVSPQVVMMVESHPSMRLAPDSTMRLPRTVRSELPLPVWSSSPKMAVSPPPAAMVRLPVTSAGPASTTQSPAMTTLPYTPASTPGALTVPVQVWVPNPAGWAAAAAPGPAASAPITIPPIPTMENKRIFGRIAAAFPLVRYLRYRPEADPGLSSPGKCRQDCLQQTPNVAPVAGQTAALAELRD